MKRWCNGDHGGSSSMFRRWYVWWIDVSIVVLWKWRANEKGTKIKNEPIWIRVNRMRNGVSVFSGSASAQHATTQTTEIANSISKMLSESFCVYWTDGRSVSRSFRRIRYDKWPTDRPTGVKTNREEKNNLIYLLGIYLLHAILPLHSRRPFDYRVYVTFYLRKIMFVWKCLSESDDVFVPCVRTSKLFLPFCVPFK